MFKAPHGQPLWHVERIAATKSIQRSPEYQSTMKLVIWHQIWWVDGRDRSHPTTQPGQQASAPHNLSHFQGVTGFSCFPMWGSRNEFVYPPPTINDSSPEAKPKQRLGEHQIGARKKLPPPSHAHVLVTSYSLVWNCSEGLACGLRS